MTSVANVLGIERFSASELGALAATAEAIGVDVDALATVISIESGFNPSAENPFSGAVGLIQFMPSTARLLGTTAAHLKRMSTIQQLGYVRKYFERVRCVGRARDAGDLYLCVFCPALRGLPDSEVVARRGVTSVGRCGTESAVYSQNSGLDINGDGVLTVGDIRRVALQRLANATGRIEIKSSLGQKKRLLPFLLGGGAAYAIGKIMGWL